eukprot:g1646.t1
MHGRHSPDHFTFRLAHWMPALEEDPPCRLVSGCLVGAKLAAGPSGGRRQRLEGADLQSNAVPVFPGARQVRAPAQLVRAEAFGPDCSASSTSIGLLGISPAWTARRDLRVPHFLRAFFGSDPGGLYKVGRRFPSPRPPLSAFGRSRGNAPPKGGAGRHICRALESPPRMYKVTRSQ